MNSSASGQSVLEQLPAGARILVIRLRSLGDCVLTTPALALLKAWRRDLRIGVAVEDRFAGLFEGNEDVADILRPTVTALSRWRASLCLNLHGGTRSIALTLASGARHRAGFAHYRAQDIYSIRIPRAQEVLGEERVVHTAEHLASAMFHLGVPRAEIPRANLFAGGKRKEKDGPYAVIHPFASAPDKTWPAENFIEAARYLECNCEVEPVFIGAQEDDLGAFCGFCTMSGLPLDHLKDLMAGAALFLGNDSGPAHIAAAFGLPVAVVFGTSDHRIWGPWRTNSEVLRAPGGISGVTAPQMIAALERLRVPA